MSTRNKFQHKNKTGCNIFVRRIYVLFLILILVSGAAHAKRLHLEKEYRSVWCNAHNGVMEYTLSDKTRVDCLTDSYAVEFDFACKWAECLGQAIYYGRQTGKQAACVLIMENGEKDLKYLYRLRRSAYRKGVNVRTFTMKPEHLYKQSETIRKD